MDLSLDQSSPLVREMAARDLEPRLFLYKSPLFKGILYLIVLYFYYREQSEDGGAATKRKTVVL